MLIGYRTEDAFGSGERDLIAVTNHERDELDNSYVAENYDVYELYEQGYKECVWVCKDIVDIGECYYWSNWGYDYYVVDKYEFEDYIILCDLGPEGKLIAYKECKIFEGIDTIVLEEYAERM